MKQSKYNIYLPVESGEIIVYNCLTDKSAKIDDQMRTAITEGATAIEDQSLKKTLVEMGFIIDDDHDELKIIRSRRREAIARSFAEQIGITFILTYSCNLACTYCYEQGIRSLGGMMSATTIHTIMDFVHSRIEKKPSMQRLVSRLYGGEPLLNWKGCSHILKEIEETVSEHSISKNVALITNATLFTDAIWETLASFGLEKLQITLDGCKEDHNSRRITPDGEGTYDLIMENIGRALDNNIEPEIRVNLDEKNYQRAEILFDDLKERKYQVPIQVGIVSGLEMHCPTDRVNCLTPTSVAEVLPSIWKKAEDRGFAIVGDSINTPVFCQFDLLDFYVVDPFLDVYKCWDLIGVEEHKIGKISDGVFLAEYPYFDSTSRDVTLFNGCAGCDILPLCRGGCAARAYDCFGTYHAAGCYQERYLMEQKLKRYLTEKLRGG